MNTSHSRPKRIHRIQRESCLALLIIGIGLPLLEAQEALPDEAHTLGGRDIAGPFVAEALRNNPSLAAYDKRFQAAKESIHSAAALPNPKVQITHFVESIQTRTGPQRQAIALQQPLPGFGRLSRKRDIAMAQSNALWQAYAVQQFKLVDQVTQSALELAYLGKASAITQQNIDLLERLQSVVEDKVKSGGNLGDLLKLQLETERFRDLLSRQTNQQIAASATLESLIGRTPSDTLIRIDWSAPTATQNDSKIWLQAIQSKAPQLVMLRSIESSQESRERLAKLANRPDFSVGINYIRTGDSINPSTPDNGRDPWALMVGVSLPVWGKANHSIARQATLEREAISAQIKDLELTLLGQGRSWIAKLQDSQARIERYETNLLPLARQAHEITQASYQSGKASILELIDSDRVLLNLETEYWRAAADAWIAQWKLATLSGGLWLN